MKKKTASKKLNDHIKVLMLMMVCAALTCVLAVFLIAYVLVKGVPNLSWELLRTKPSYLDGTIGILPDIISTVCMVLVGIMNLGGVVCALLIKSAGVPIPLACLASVAVGAGCGALNGLIIGSLDIPAMLVTLCGLEVYSGLALAITGGPAINGMSDSFKNIANGSIGSIPYVLFIFIGVLIVVAFIMKHTVFGHEVYFLGSNKQAARYSGINTLRTTILAHTMSGILGGISGIIITSHLNSAKSSNGSTYTLLSLLIVVLGGINPDGGGGTVAGVTFSIVLLQLIANAFTIMHAPDTLKTLHNGIYVMNGKKYVIR